MKLTDSQQRAIKFGGSNLQLIACAGSGKTEVVARRVVHLLTPGRSDSLIPTNIIAFTFTDKAAAELKERIFTRTREMLGDVPGMAEMFVGTIHAFCLELLKSRVAEVPQVRGPERGPAGAVRRSPQQAERAHHLDRPHGRGAEALSGHPALHHRAVDPARGRTRVTPSSTAARSLDGLEAYGHCSTRTATSTTPRSSRRPSMS